MIARNRLGLLVGKFAGIARLLDRDHAGPALAGAQTDQDLIALRQWLVVQPENPGADSPRIAWGRSDMRNDVAALDEQFAVERDADRASGAVAAAERRYRPAFHALDLCDLAGGHDDDFIAGSEMTGFDPARDDAAVVELVDRLHRQPQRQLLQRPGRLECIQRLDHGRAPVPADSRSVFGNAVTVARGNRNHGRWRHAEADQMRGNLVADLLEPDSTEIDPVHLVDDDGDLLDPQQMQQIAVTSRLVAHTFQCVDDQHRTVGLR